MLKSEYKFTFFIFCYIIKHGDNMNKWLEKNIHKILYYNFIICLTIFILTNFIRITLLYFGYTGLYHMLNTFNCYWFILPIQVFIYLFCLKAKIIKADKFDCIIYALILSNMISCLFAMDYNISILGYINRNEGMIALLSYYLMFLNVRILNKKDINKLLNILIYTGIFNCLYAVLQVIFKAPFVVKFKWRWMASGLNYNPNFFGTFMCTVGLLSICMYLFNDKRKGFYFISSLIMLIGLVLAQSTGPIIGYFFGILVLLIILFIRKIKVWKKFLKLGIVLIITFFISVYGTDYLFNNVYKYKDTDSYTIKGDIDRIIIYGCDVLGIDAKWIKKNTHLSNVDNITLNTISSNRFDIWKRTIPIIKDNWLVGIGIDNFGIAHNKYYNYSLYDKVHNVYLQILVTNGVIGFIPYIIWLVMVLYCGYKNHSNNIIILLIPFIGYAFQAIFNISVIDVAPIFYILSGMIVGCKEE